MTVLGYKIDAQGENIAKKAQRHKFNSNLQAWPAVSPTPK